MLTLYISSYGYKIPSGHYKKKLKGRAQRWGKIYFRYVLYLSMIWFVLHMISERETAVYFKPMGGVVGQVLLWGAFSPVPPVPPLQTGSSCIHVFTMAVSQGIRMCKAAMSDRSTLDSNALESSDRDQLSLYFFPIHELKRKMMFNCMCVRKKSTICRQLKKQKKKKSPQSLMNLMN